MQNTNKRTDTRRMLEDLDEVEDGRNFGSPKNGENLASPNLDARPQNSDGPHSSNLRNENSGEKVLILTI